MGAISSKCSFIVVFNIVSSDFTKSFVSLFSFFMSKTSFRNSLISSKSTLMLEFGMLSSSAVLAEFSSGPVFAVLSSSAAFVLAVFVSGRDPLCLHFSRSCRHL